MSEVQKDKVQKLITGATKGALMGKKAVGFVSKSAAKNQLRKMSTNVAVGSQSKFSRLIPFIGNANIVEFEFTFIL